jgi:antitoxin ParD1/3/4
MNTFPIHLNENLAHYLQAQIASGHYASPSDYIQALIQEDQARKTQIERTLLEALDTPATPMTDDDWAYIRTQVRQNLSQPNPHA